MTRIGTGKNLFKSVVKEGLPEEVSIVGEDNQPASIRGRRSPGRGTVNAKAKLSEF